MRGFLPAAVIALFLVGLMVQNLPEARAGAAGILDWIKEKIPVFQMPLVGDIAWLVFKYIVLPLAVFLIFIVMLIVVLVRRR